MKKITILMSLFAAVSLMQVNAATYVCNNTEPIIDDGSETEGSLSWCLGEAKDAGDIIVFDAGMSGKTIEFLGAVKIENSVTIDASALAQPIIFDGKGNNPILTVGEYATRNNNTQLNKFYNIIFQNGKSTTDEAGAINILSQKVYFINCQFLNNKATVDNTSHNPGAIRCMPTISSLYFTGCIFKGNQAPRFGGAISVDVAHLEIDRCLFEGNSVGVNASVIDIKGATASGANTTPGVTIRNSTFLNNTVGTHSKSNDGHLIYVPTFSDDNTGTYYPLYLFNNTFVGNTNVNRAATSTVYSTNQSIIAGGNIFGGNRCKDNGTGVIFSNDMRVGNTPGIITSYGYNIYYGIMPSDSPMASTDTQYRDWTAAPYVAATANAAGVCIPNEENGLWKNLKKIPNELLVEFLGEDPVDQTGALRTSKLGLIGAYELPSYVLEVTDESYASTPENGLSVYKPGEKAVLTNISSEFVSWFINGQHHTDNPYELLMDQDKSVIANYGQISAVKDITVAGAQIYVSGNNLKVKNLAGISVDIYSVTGKKVVSQIIDSENIDLTALPKGIYVVKAGNLAKKIVR